MTQQATAPSAPLVFWTAGHGDSCAANVDTYAGEWACSQCHATLKQIRVRPLPAGAADLAESDEFYRTYLRPLANSLGEGKFSAKEVWARLVAAVLESPPGKEWLPRVEATKGCAAPIKLKIARRSSADDRLGGEPSWAGPGAWPVCRSCSKPMMFLLQIRLEPLRALVFLCQSSDQCPTADPEKGASAVVLVPEEGESTLVPPAQHLTREQFEDLPSKQQKSLSPTLLGVTFSMTRPQPDNPVPQWSEPPDRTRDLKFEVWSVLRNHLGSPWKRQEIAMMNRVAGAPFGYPTWIQTDQTPSCPECKAPMRFVAQIDTTAHPDLEDLVNLGSGGACYLFACSEHRQGRFLYQSS